MTEANRTIDMRMTWRIAAQIIAAALENGTGTGKTAARAELNRMAEILDAMNDATERLQTFDVIAAPPAKAAAALGQSFASEDEAKTYADELERHGYTADRLPAHETVSAAEALRIAAEHFADDRLTPKPEADA